MYVVFPVESTVKCTEFSLTQVPATFTAFDPSVLGATITVSVVFPLNDDKESEKEFGIAVLFKKAHLISEYKIPSKIVIPPVKSELPTVASSPDTTFPLAGKPFMPIEPGTPLTIKFEISKALCTDASKSIPIKDVLEVIRLNLLMEYIFQLPVPVIVTPSCALRADESDQSMVLKLSTVAYLLHDRVMHNCIKKKLPAAPLDKSNI